MAAAGHFRSGVKDLAASHDSSKNGVRSCLAPLLVALFRYSGHDPFFWRNRVISLDYNGFSKIFSI
jgi:hypothetical protein